MNRNTSLLLALTCLTALALILLVPNSSSQADVGWIESVDPLILETMLVEDEAEFIVFLKEQADLSGAEQITNKTDKGTFVFERLTALAASTQPPIIDELKKLGAEYQPFWVANMIWVQGDATVLHTMAQRPEISFVYANPAIRQDLPRNQGLAKLSPTEPTIPWHIDLVGAPEVWAAGFTGQGAVVGGQDTGYDWAHPALANAYRGNDPGGVDHNYNWHDAIHIGPVTCGPDSQVPCDGHGHGTHTMGTMVGDDGGNNQIGMAPGAQWIGCRNMNDQGIGSPATYSECYQWFIAPTDLDGMNPDPAKAPHAINNSWSCPVSEGCNDPAILQTVVENVRAAGILTVHSAGNSGPGCETINTPAAIYDASFSVGATTDLDVISSFSSRGPVSVDGSNRPKPDITAPGQSVYSSTPGGNYANLSGTSMAGPHVAGLAALLVSANPSLAGEVDSLEMAITQSAIPKTASETCGSVPGSQVPNNTYGYGRIDAFGALNLILELEPKFYYPFVATSLDGF
jgi:subtilisin family serine protease